MPERLIRHKAIVDNLPLRPALSTLVGNRWEGWTPHITQLFTIIITVFTADRTSLLSHIHSIFDMSQPSTLSSTFRILFDAALQDYKDKTGNSLIDHPIAKQLESCESVNSITAIFQEQARSFREFREDDGRLTKALNSSVDVLCAPAICSALNEAIGLVVRQKNNRPCTLLLMSSAAIPSCEGNIRRLWHFTRRMSLPPI